MKGNGPSFLWLGAALPAAAALGLAVSKDAVAVMFIVLLDARSFVVAPVVAGDLLLASGAVTAGNGRGLNTLAIVAEGRALHGCANTVGAPAFPPGPDKLK